MVFVLWPWRFVTLCVHSLSELSGRRIGLFSYGSGLAASMFSMKVCAVEDGARKAKLQKLLHGISDTVSRLDNRQEVLPQEFADVLKLRAYTHLKSDYKPSMSSDNIFPGTYYLTEVDAKFRRFYARKPLPPRNGHATNGH